jgi:exodeoxyribonuclease-3
MSQKMLRVVSANLNGIRSANVKGFLNWLNKQDADVVCVQELKAQIDDLSPDMRKPGIYTGYFHCAVKKGYSGVGIYTRRPPDRVIEGLGNEEFDAEGRYLQLDFGSLSVVSSTCPPAPARRNARLQSSASWICSCLTWRRCAPANAR